MNVVCNEGKGNMRTLEQKVDILVRYCAAESEQARRYYHADLQSILTSGERMDARRSIDRALSDLGIPDHLLGYAYLQAAIYLVVRQPEAAYAVTGCVYPAVAMRYSTTAQLVERAIRHAVERGWPAATRVCEKCISAVSSVPAAENPPMPSLSPGSPMWFANDLMKPPEVIRRLFYI